MRITSHQKGFLLVELIVAVFLFSIVMVVAMGAIVSAIDANKKTQSLESVMNNLNLALDEITRSLAVGSNYQGVPDVETDEITFESQDGELVTYKIHDLSTRGYISRKVDVGGRELRMTAYEINLQSGTHFRISGIPGSVGSAEQPRVEIFLNGTVKAGPRNDTDFSLQTMVSQRIPDF